MTRVVLVPGVLALLPEYAGIEDPVADLRAAALGAVGRLGTDVEVRGDARVAAYLLGATEVSRQDSVLPRPPDWDLLVVANGSAKRTEKAPGHLNEQAAVFDADLGASLRAGEPVVDTALAAELWADVAAFDGLNGLGAAEVHYDDAPYGVQYWVMTWSC